ncbi:MAG TPA: rod shape-determining protein MreC [Thermoanaerobaculia bacterium]|nr:rod shape-determining protein MreC [Thermoanaerobaculia bacterium]
MDERRTGWLLILVLAGQLVFLAVRVAGRGGHGTALESAGLRVLGPLAQLVAVVSESFAGSRESFALHGRLIAENRALQREVVDLKLRLLRSQDLGDELARLGAAVGYAAPPAGDVRAADVIYVDRSSLLRTLVLYAGPRPARFNQAVLSPEGLVGRVVVAAGPYAKVQLITDRAAAVGAMALRTRRQGVVRGSARDAGFGLELDYVPLQADVRVGDRIVTAGIDGIYPRGIPVGTVASVEPGGQLFHKIALVPAVDFGALDQVFLLDHEPVPNPIKEALPGVRRR